MNKWIEKLHIRLQYFLWGRHCRTPMKCFFSDATRIFPGVAFMPFQEASSKNKITMSGGAKSGLNLSIERGENIRTSTSASRQSERHLKRLIICLWTVLGETDCEKFTLKNISQTSSSFVRPLRLSRNYGVWEDSAATVVLLAFTPWLTYSFTSTSSKKSRNLSWMRLNLLMQSGWHCVRLSNFFSRISCLWWHPRFKSCSVWPSRVLI